MSVAANQMLPFIPPSNVVPPAPVSVVPVAASAIWESVASSSQGRMVVSGDWQLSRPFPSWKELTAGGPTGEVVLVGRNLGTWDTSLVLFLVHTRKWCLDARVGFRMESVPSQLSVLLDRFTVAQTAVPVGQIKSPSVWARTQSVTEDWTKRSRENIAFLGDCTLGFLHLIHFPRRFRWIDFIVELQQSWTNSFLIVSLVSFLVGVVLAFQAAVQLQPFGAAIFVADLVGLAVVREMGPMMAAVIVAGGTGAGFAARLGNMRVDQEVDAIETLGLSSVDFLVLPRLLAVTLILPVLALYANVLGILGGMLVSGTMLRIPPAAYWVEIQERVGLSDVTTGLAKSLFFGSIVGLVGCLRGLRCDRSAAGVGTATSSAVVTAILLVVVADALFALIFNVLGI